jgi:hypothetical protein
MQGCGSGDSFEIDSDWGRLSIVQRALYKVRLDSPLMSTHPQAYVLSILVFFLVEFQPSRALNFLTCNDDFGWKAYEL